MNKWGVFVLESEVKHVVPVHNDGAIIYPHFCSFGCYCNPSIDKDDWIVIHNETIKSH